MDKDLTLEEYAILKALVQHQATMSLVLRRRDEPMLRRIEAKLEALIIVAASRVIASEGLDRKR